MNNPTPKELADRLDIAVTLPIVHTPEPCDLCELLREAAQYLRQLEVPDDAPKSVSVDFVFCNGELFVDKIHCQNCRNLSAQLAAVIEKYDKLENDKWDQDNEVIKLLARVAELELLKGESK